MSDEPKKRSRAWIGWALIALLVLYILAAGPGLWVCDRLQSERVIHTYDAIYAPLDWACDQNEFIGGVMAWYRGRWLATPKPR